MSHVSHISNLPEALDGQGRLQVAAANTDALLTKIVDFSGQGQNDISDDGVISKPQCFMYGRDRAGNKMRAVDIADDGKLNVNVVSTAGDGDLSARTDITNITTSKKLKCDSNGNLQVGIAENPTVHLRGNDGDNGGGSNRLIKCSATGMLITKPDLDLYAGAINNTTAIGDGSTQLRTVPLGYDRAGGKGVALLVDSSGVLATTTRLKANTNPAGSGTECHATCDSGGRMYINSDIGVPINALQDDGGTIVKSLRCDATGKLVTIAVPNDSWGAIGGFTAGTGSQWSANAFSTAIDMTYHTTLEFHVQGSMSAGHNIFICVSNDNSSYVRHQAVTTQSIGGTDVFKGSFTSGFRHVKLENGGADISTTTFKEYAVYN